MFRPGHNYTHEEIYQTLSVGNAGGIRIKANTDHTVRRAVLLTSVPTLGMPKDRELNVIPGQVPNPLHFPSGCKFHPRCPRAIPICYEQSPSLLQQTDAGHWVACHYVERQES